MLFFAHIPFVVNRAFSATPTERLQQSISQTPSLTQEHEKMVSHANCRISVWLAMRIAESVQIAESVFGHD